MGVPKRGFVVTEEELGFVGFGLGLVFAVFELGFRLALGLVFAVFELGFILAIVLELGESLLGLGLELLLVEGFWSVPLESALQ
jgi:hypothetical protein